MTTYGVTSSGFVIKTLENIVDEQEEKLWSYYPNANTNEGSFHGTFIGLYADGMSEVWEMGQDLYNVFDPDSATGAALDRLGAFKRVTRLAASYSTVTLKFTGVNGTNIPAGTNVSVLNDSDIVFATDSLVTIAAGTATVTATCLVTGPTSANSGTLTVLDNPISGITDVTNDLDATLGRNLETDAEYRIRINTAGTNVNKCTENGIEQGIYELNTENPNEPTINNAYVIPNDTNAYVGSRPPGSVELFVYLDNTTQDDRDDEIAARLQLIKGAGIDTYGTISKTVTDYKGLSKTVKFSRVSEVDIYLILDIQATATEFPATGQDDILTNVLAWGNALGAGKDVVVTGYASLENTVGLTEGITNITTKIGIAAGPTLSANIVIDDGSGGTLEISKWDSSRIDINLTLV